MAKTTLQKRLARIARMDKGFISGDEAQQLMFALWAARQLPTTMAGCAYRTTLREYEETGHTVPKWALEGIEE